MNDTHMKLLLHGDGFVDKSMYKQQVTNMGTAVVNNFGKFGNNSFYFDGANARIQLPNLISANQPFTIDLWFYGTAQKNNTIWSHGGTNTPHGTGGGVEYFGDLSLIYYCSGFLIQGAPISANTWHHLAIVGDRVSVKLYLNGVLYGQVANYAYSFSSAGETIGANDSAYGIENFAGYIDEIRISDVVRYTENFTPPTEPYPDAEVQTYINRVDFGDRTLIDLTSDTISESDVLDGVRFHAASGEIGIGAIPAQGAQTITPALTAQSIAGGRYLSGTQTIAAITKELLATLDADFVAENIKKDVDLFGLIGTLEGGGKLSYGTITIASDLELSTGFSIQHNLGVIPTWGCVFVMPYSKELEKSELIIYSLCFTDKQYQYISCAESAYYGSFSRGAAVYCGDRKITTTIKALDTVSEKRAFPFWGATENAINVSQGDLGYVADFIAGCKYIWIMCGD